MTAPKDLDIAAEDRALADAWVPTPPRRTDAAFARSVAAGVASRKRPLRAFWAVPALATAAAAVALVLSVPGEIAPAHDGGSASSAPSSARFALDLSATSTALQTNAPDLLDDSALIALAADTQDGAFIDVDANAASGFALQNTDDDEADDDTQNALDGDSLESDVNSLDGNSLDATTGALFASSVEGADDATLLAMADLFTLPADSPYKF